VDFEYLAGVARLNETVSDLLAAAGWFEAAEQEAFQHEQTALGDQQRWPRRRLRDSSSENQRAAVKRCNAEGQQLSLTVLVSKDNCIFYVRAYNADGDRSLPVYPAPER